MTKLEKAYYSCMTKMYQASEPSANFQELLDNADINENGLKDIHYENYLIDRDVAVEIFDETVKEFKIPKHQITYLSRAVWLGASPKFKKNNETR